MDYTQILRFFPEVEKPKEKLSFKTKLIWTGLILVIFFILSYIPLLGLGQNSLQQFEQLSIILGASFGSLISLGIGPIVTASIVLQLVVGSGILGIDTTTPAGRQKFSALQKIATIFFIIFEAAAYVFAGGLAPNADLAGTSQYLIMQLALIGQLILGGYLIVLMDEVTTKWGFGSGVSLFIAAGVASQIFIRAFNPLAAPTNPDVQIGAIPFLIKALGGGDVTGAMISAAAIITTIAVFVVAVYAQAMKVEIPLSFGRVRGFGMRWPLKFIYTSNIPVILIAALMANIQLWARLLQNAGHPWLGTFSGNSPASGLIYWINPPNVLNAVINGSATSSMALQALGYMSMMVFGSIIFSVMWVKTANMDAAAQAKQILASGMQIPGFRRDPRVLESILNRYIPALTVLGAVAVGFLASVADLGDALSRGTGILLAVMIVYKMYEDIAKQHAFEMHPALKKVIAPD